MMMLVALLGPMVGCGATEVVDREPGGRAILIRSPQPDEGDIRELHARHGVKTVINLRGERPDESWFEDEQAGVRAIGAEWVHIPLNTADAPDEAHVRRFLELVDDPKRRPVLLHCQGGIHRTGVLTAVYRMARNGWSNDDALREMEDHWFNWGVTDREGIKDYVRRFDRSRYPDPNPPGEPQAGFRFADPGAAGSKPSGPASAKPATRP